MFFPKTCFKKQRKIQKYFFSTATIYLVLCLISRAGSTEESPKNSLPPAPDTGSLEEDFSAGGTRDDRRLTEVCGANGQKIGYLLGNKNREFTLSAHPTFWFYISNNAKKVKQIKFVLTELETGKTIYDRVVEMPEEEGTIAIAIPPEPQYTLSVNVNYSWSLLVDCGEANNGSVIALEGWLYRLPLNADLQNKLAAAPDEDKYKVYLENDLLYDALDDIAQRRTAEPKNDRLKTAWNQLLVELGWQELIKIK